MLFLGFEVSTFAIKQKRKRKQILSFLVGSNVKTLKTIGFLAALFNRLKQHGLPKQIYFQYFYVFSWLD